MKVLVTGSSGLIGSAVVKHFDALADVVVGVDNNMRADFFGPDGDTRPTLVRLLASTRRFEPRELDVRDRPGLERLFLEAGPFDLIVHAAAQPSHDLAARRPVDDWDVNATGTLNLLEATRRGSPEAVFVHMSTNKVYGDAPNELPLVELPLRWDYARPGDREGIDETMRIDASRHSVFGASKTAADVMVQEYGRTFGLRTTCLRAGCMTGAEHSAVELHGFLAYLVKVQLEGGLYRVFGYKGKQVRDNLASEDVARAVEAIYRRPGCGAVFNLGGGRENACSILEAFRKVEEISGAAARYEVLERHRDGDHLCYMTDTTRFRTAYPEWRVERSLDDVLVDLVRGWRERVGAARVAS